MLYKVKSLKGYRLHGLDGEIGWVKEFYFDDHHWTIRYLVADTGTWLTDRQVLISPYALDVINDKDQNIEVALTMGGRITACRMCGDLTRILCGT
jgi:PRC-barrel domain protein